MDVSKKLDSILVATGGFGRFQFFQFTLLAIAVVFTGSPFFGYVFNAGMVPHRCMVESCGDKDERSEFLPSWWQDAIPANSEGAPSSCMMYSVISNNSSCSFDNSSVERCSSWVYSGDANTILTEFNMTCPENAWKVTLVGSINSFGTLIGSPIVGFISDRFGRKTTLMCSILLSSIVGTIQSFSGSYIMFAILECLAAISLSSIYGVAFIMAMEQVHPKKREVCGGVIVWANSFGMVWLGLVAWMVQDWRKTLRIVYLPGFLVISYYWLMPESIRWLVQRGRLKESRNILLKSAKFNRVQINDELKSELSSWERNELKLEENKNSKGESIFTALRQVARSRILLIRLGICSFCWITNVLVYYGLNLNSVSLAGTDNIYLNFILVTIIEAPAYILTCMSMIRFGRRRSFSTFLLLSSMACFASPLLRGGAKWATLPVYLFGKLTISCSFDVVYIYTSEIFPTNLRNSMLSLCFMIGRIGSILAPQTPLLSNISPMLPMMLFGAVALIASLLSSFFPETKGRTLPNTIEEAENLGLKIVAETTNKITVNDGSLENISLHSTFS